MVSLSDPQIALPCPRCLFTADPTLSAQDSSSSLVSLASALGDFQPRGSKKGLVNKSRPSSPLPHCEAIHNQISPAVRHHRHSSSPAALLLSLSSQHDRSRRPGHLSSSWAPASDRISSAPMERLKNVGRFRRISMGPSHAGHKTQHLPRKPFSILAVGSLSTPSVF